MGCDIHFYVEKKDGDKWVSADKWTPSRWDGSLEVKHEDSFYDDRNYILFSVLADVRNFRDTRINPISEPRGVPDDATQEVRDAVFFYGDHSHSWLLVSEIEAYDWNQDIEDNGSSFNIKDRCMKFLEETLSRMKALGDSDKVRCVFGFDN